MLPCMRTTRSPVPSPQDVTWTGPPSRTRRDYRGPGGRRRRRPRRPAAVSIGPAKGRPRAPILESRHGSRHRVSRHVRLDADRATGAGGAARPARRRPAAVRLRGGDTAAVAALVGRPRRPPGDLPDALPRRPRARLARDAEDLRAARPRAPADDLRPARPRRPDRLTPSRAREAVI